MESRRKYNGTVSADRSGDCRRRASHHRRVDRQSDRFPRPACLTTACSGRRCAPTPGFIALRPIRMDEERAQERRPPREERPIRLGARLGARLLGVAAQLLPANGIASPRCPICYRQALYSTPKGSGRAIASIGWTERKCKTNGLTSGSLPAILR